MSDDSTPASTPGDAPDVTPDDTPDAAPEPTPESQPEATAPPRPGAVRRTAAGAWHVPAAFGYLLVRPRLWPAAALPALTAAAGMIAGVTAGWLAAPRVDSAVVAESWGTWLAIPVRVAIWIGTPLTGMLVGLALALLLAGPLLERLQRKVEILEAGRSPDDGRGLLWDILQSLRGGFFFALAAPFVLLLGLVPFVGPPLGVLWAARSLAFQQTDSPLGRRGLGFGARRRWHREWRAESLGFGLAGLATLVVPVLNLCAAPALAVGSARLVLELEQLAPAPAPEPEPEGEGAPEAAAGDGGRGEEGAEAKPEPSPPATDDPASDPESA